MSDLAARLYDAHHRALEDPTSVPAWGNASTEERRAWEAAARELSVDEDDACRARTEAGRAAAAAYERRRAAYASGCYQQWALMDTEGDEVSRGVDFEGGVVFVALTDGYVSSVEKVHHGHGPRQRFVIRQRYLQRGDTLTLDTREKWA